MAVQQSQYYFITSTENPANAGVDVSGYATGSAFRATEVGYLLYVLDAARADPTQYINAASGSRVQNFFIDGEEETYYVISPWRNSSTEFSVVTWQFTSAQDLNDNILKIPSEYGTPAFTDTDGWSQSNPGNIAEVLTTLSSSFLLNGFDQFLYNPLVP